MRQVYYLFRRDEKTHRKRLWDLAKAVEPEFEAPASEPVR